MNLKVFSLILIAAMSCCATTSQTTKMVEVKKLSVDEFTNKYWRPRDDTPIVINDYLVDIDKVNINHKYFYVSYNKKCFSVATESYDPDQFKEIKKPIEEYPGLYFTRKKECIKSDDQIFSNGFSVGISEHEISDESAKKRFGSTWKSKVVMIDHLLNINSFKGRVTSDVLHDNDSLTILRLRYKILCAGKKNEVYEIVAQANSYQESLDFVTKYNYQLPDDIMQIISTFKCRKDR